MQAFMIVVAIISVIIFLLFAATIYLLVEYLDVQKKPPNNPTAFLKKEKKEEEKNLKKLVFIGDSLTHGTMSVNFINMIKEQLGEESYQYINAGINGNLTYHVLLRLKPIIACKPDIIVLLIGTNDANREYWGNKLNFPKNMTILPQEPSYKWFKKNYQLILEILSEKTDAKIAICSIPPLGEDLESTAYKQSLKYSSFIRKVSEDYNVNYLPVHEKMSEYLRNNTSNPKYPFERRLVHIAFLKKYLFGIKFDKIAAFNGHKLLIDHLHLNTNGATIITKQILEFLDQIELEN